MDVGCGPAIMLGDSTLEEVYPSKFVGIYIDRDSTWNYHIDSVCSKLQEDLSLKKIKALLKEMGKALLTQRNVNKAIKDGMPKLDDFLGEIEECRNIRLKAMKQERDVMNRSGSFELRELDPAPNPVFFSASTQTEDVPAVALVPAPVGVPAPAAALIPASIPSTPLNSQVPASQIPLGNWERLLSKKERKQLKRAEAASKKGKKKAQVSEPVKEAPGKTSTKPLRPRPKKPRAEAILIKPLDQKKRRPQSNTSDEPRTGMFSSNWENRRTRTVLLLSSKPLLVTKAHFELFNRDSRPRRSIYEVIRALKDALPELPGETGGLQGLVNKTKSEPAAYGNC
ncbi:hypothetical protein J6590_061306 [Homalodisca vitripennis]|nr:hypothetical protein J6590_061306 [Homalodisca vitripennis]